MLCFFADSLAGEQIVGIDILSNCKGIPSIPLCPESPTIPKLTFFFRRRTRQAVRIATGSRQETPGEFASLLLQQDYNIRRKESGIRG